jgi:23S rRNA pseudouridine2605 synthase
MRKPTNKSANKPASRSGSQFPSFSKSQTKSQNAPAKKFAPKKDAAKKDVTPKKDFRTVASGESPSSGPSAKVPSTRGPSTKGSSRGPSKKTQSASQKPFAAKNAKPASLSPSPYSPSASSAFSPKSKPSKSKPLSSKSVSPRFESAPSKSAKKPEGKRFGKTSKPKARTNQEILSEALSPKPKPKFKAGPPAKKASAKNAQFKPTNKGAKRRAEAETCRLNKWIADSGLCSRREADTLIETGLVTVNDKRVSQLGTQIIPGVDLVKVNGQLVVVSRKTQTILFHKPKGVLTTRKDEQGRKTIYDCINKEFHTLDPAGRLDRESTGALILSSDGELIFRLTHPKYHVPKVYRVKVDTPFTPKMLDKLTEGIFFEEEEKLAKADALDWEGPDTLKMTLSTGYNRQIRRMMEAIGKEVVSLKRLSVGPVSLGHLAPGAARVLLPHELRALYQAVKLK